MGDFIRRNPLLATLCAVAFLLAVALAVEFVVTRPGGNAGPPRRAAPAEAKLLPPLAANPPEQAFPETTARPLFTPTRRLAPEPAAAQQQPAFVRGQYVLLGVTIARDTRIAMLREKATGKIVRVARGAQVNGITLSSVDPETVTLSMNGEQEQLPLAVQKAGTPGQPVTPGGPATPPATAALQGPFGAAGQAPGAPPGAAGNLVSTPMPIPPGGFTGGGFPMPPGAAAPGAAMPGPPQGVPIPGMPGAPNPATPRSTAADPNAGLSPEEILARRRARRAQQSQ